VTEVIELRRYTLRPGQRDVLIELFDREFVESQEALGMRILGQFRDLGDPDQFVWVRGFPDMTVRLTALTAFYGGPVWKAHAATANPTMVDSDNVLLLRPAGADLLADPSVRDSVASSLVVATIYDLAEPVDDELVAHFGGSVTPLVERAGGVPLGLLSTEYAENDFPGLPVISGVHRMVSLVSCADREVADRIVGLPAIDRLPVYENLVLAPTDRSVLR
jgi:hypothetical protein